MVNQKSMCNQGQPVRHGPLSRIWKVAIIVGTLVLFIIISFRYWPHVHWKYTEMRLDSHEVHAIPATVMPPTAVPADWLPYHFEGMEIRLPPGFKDRNTSGLTAKIESFGNGSETIHVAMPMDAGEVYQLFGFAKFHPEAAGLTIPRLRLLCYQADSTDFRWSMTSDEVRWHGFCMSAGQLFRLREVGRVETLFGDDIDGIAHFDGQSAIYDWHCKDSVKRGGIHFRTTPPKLLDPSWVRAVCQSLKIAGNDQGNRSHPGEQ